jgi:hypothetical protein
MEAFRPAKVAASDVRVGDGTADAVAVGWVTVGWDDALAEGSEEHADSATSAAMVAADAPIRISEAPMNPRPLPRLVYRFAHRDAAR